MIGFSRIRWQGLFLIFLALLSLGCSASTKVNSKATGTGQEEYNEKPVIISEVTLGPGDEIEIWVWRNPDLNGQYKLDSSGKVFIPLVGVVQAGGISAFELREKVEEGLSKYLVNPQIRVTVTAYRSRKVYVLGEVNRPGIYHLGGDMATLVGAIAKSGGFTKDANPRSVILVRGGLEEGNIEGFNMTTLLKKGDVDQSPLLGGGDIVYVPSSFVAKVDRFFQLLNTIVQPLVEIERGIILYPLARDVLKGEDTRVGVGVIVR